MVIVLTGALATVVAMAAPAGAHTVGGVNATNYRTTIRSVSAGATGVTVRAIDNGDRLELRNTGKQDVIVEGYDDEPYLRVGPRGAFENTRSPARYLNRARRNPEPPPASADPTAAPEWKKVGSGTTVRWHDHRAHWMDTVDPPVVQRAPGEEHLIQAFTIVLRRGGETIRVKGDVRWIPGPSPWPWIAGAAVLAIGTVVAARRRAAAGVLGAVLAAALTGAVVHAVGSWTYATNPFGNRAGDALPTIGAVALGAVALVQLRRRGLRAAAPLLVFAGLFLGIAIGLADMSALSKSQLPTDLAPALDRLTIAVALGGGFGVAVGAAFHVAEHRPSPPPPPGATGPAAPGPRSENESHSMMKG